MGATQLQKESVRIQRALISGTSAGFVALVLAGGLGCSTLPNANTRSYAFPADAYVGLKSLPHPYTVRGIVRSKMDFSSLDPVHEEKQLCRNYYNKAVKDLVERARKHGADAVIDVKSVVFFENGKTEMHATPECSDDGNEGQILVQGIAVRWN